MIVNLNLHGSSTPFLDAVQTTEEGGLIWITYTDTALLRGELH